MSPCMNTCFRACACEDACARLCVPACMLPACVCVCVRVRMPVLVGMRAWARIVFTHTRVHTHTHTHARTHTRLCKCVRVCCVCVRLWVNFVHLFLLAFSSTCKFGNVKLSVWARMSRACFYVRVRRIRVCKCLCESFRAFLHAHTRKYTYISAHVAARTCARVYACACACACVPALKRTRLYVCACGARMHNFIRVCGCGCMHVCMCARVHDGMRTPSCFSCAGMTIRLYQCTRASACLHVGGCGCGRVWNRANPPFPFLGCVG